MDPSCSRVMDVAKSLVSSHTPQSNIKMGVVLCVAGPACQRKCENGPKRFSKRFLFCGKKGGAVNLKLLVSPAFLYTDAQTL